MRAECWQRIFRDKPSQRAGICRFFQKIERLLQRLNKEILAKRDGFVNAQIFVNVIDAAVQNALETGRFVAEILV